MTTTDVSYVKIARHPAFKLSDIHDLSKDELRERTMEKFASMVYFVTNESLEVFTLRMQVCSLDQCRSVARRIVCYSYDG